MHPQTSPILGTSPELPWHIISSLGRLQVEQIARLDWARLGSGLSSFPISVFVPSWDGLRIWIVECRDSCRWTCLCPLYQDRDFLVQELEKAVPLAVPLTLSSIQHGGSSNVEL